MEAIKTEITKIDKLAYEWTLAKKDEEIARKARIEIEEKILKETNKKEEGTVKEDQIYYSVTVKFGLARTIDQEKLEQLKENVELTKNINLVFEPKPKINLKNLRYIEENEPGIYQKLSQAIITKPSKPSITIKEI